MPLLKAQMIPQQDLSVIERNRNKKNGYSLLVLKTLLQDVVPPDQSLHCQELGLVPLEDQLSIQFQVGLVVDFQQIAVADRLGILAAEVLAVELAEDDLFRQGLPLH